MEIRIMAGKIIILFIVIVLLLMVASLIGQYYKFSGGRDRYLVRLFDLDAEWNIPTAYQGVSLLICSLLTVTIGVIRKKVADEFYCGWFVLSGMFLAMAGDEILQMHENVNRPLRLMLGTKGALYYAWVIPGSGLLIGLGLYFRRFILGLPRKTKLLFIASCIVYVSGVIGLEMIGGAYLDNVGTQTFTYAVITSCEELLEMGGILLFIYALLMYLGENVGEVKIRFIAK